MRKGRHRRPIPETRGRTGSYVEVTPLPRYAVARPFIAVALACTLVALPLGAQGATPRIPEGAELTRVLTTVDADFFALFFQGCDPARLATLVTDDLEFYHDKAGVVATSGSAFVADYAKQCEARKAPDAWRSRRELVTESLRVDPVPGYGAIEYGEHRFYERKGDGPEKLAGLAVFTMLWKLDGGTWKLARVMSFGHRAAP